MKILIALLLLASPAMAQTSSQKLVKQLRTLNAEQTAEIATLREHQAATEMALLDSQAATVEAKAETAKVQQAADKQHEDLLESQALARTYWDGWQDTKKDLAHVLGQYRWAKIIIASLAALIALIGVLRFAAPALNTLPGIAVTAGVPAIVFAAVYAML